jgi:hypothetical protein
LRKNGCIQRSELFCSTRAQVWNILITEIDLNKNEYRIWYSASILKDRSAMFYIGNLGSHFSTKRNSASFIHHDSVWFSHQARRKEWTAMSRNANGYKWKVK